MEVEVIIYSVRNKINGKKYVGYKTDFNSTKDLLKSDYFGSGKHISRAVRKYGKENFERKVLLKNIFDFEKLCRYEILWVKKFNTKEPNGYNILDGGRGKLGYACTTQIKQKISRANKGRKWDDESRRKMSIKRKGRKHNLLTKKKIAESNIGKHNYYHRPLTEDEKKKISESKKGKKRSPETIQKLKKPKTDAHKKSLSLSTKKRFSNPENHPNFQYSISMKIEIAQKFHTEKYKICQLAKIYNVSWSTIKRAIMKYSNV